MAVDLAVVNGVLVTPTETRRGGVAIEAGRIVAVGLDRYLPKAKETLDVGSRHILPGLLDVHVHFRDPGFTHKEDFLSGSSAAAAGGITTVATMPNTLPVPASAETFEQKAKAIAGRSYLDYGLIGLLGDNYTDLPGLIEAGAVGLKWLMSYPLWNGIRLSPSNDGMVLEALKVAARYGITVGVHAESLEIMDHLMATLKQAGRRDPEAHIDSRPDYVEAEAVQKAIFLARVAGVPLHIVHMSSALAAEMVAEAKRRGHAVTSETCPHYLLFSRADMRRIGSLLKVNPCVKERADAERLWRGLRQGDVDAIATDHAPHTPEEKLTEDIWAAQSGFIGVETSVPLMLTAVNQGRMTLNRYVAVAAENPARIYGLYPRKGTLQVGADGDLTVVDLQREGMIRGAALHSKHPITPFEGLRVRGLPVWTIVRGHVVMREGQVVGAPQGQLLRRTVSAKPYGGSQWPGPTQWT